MHRLATVDDDRCSMDVRSCVGGQKRDDVCNLVAFGEAAKQGKFLDERAIDHSRIDIILHPW